MSRLKRESGPLDHRRNHPILTMNEKFSKCLVTSEPFAAWEPTTLLRSSALDTELRLPVSDRPAATSTPCRLYGYVNT